MARHSVTPQNVERSVPVYSTVRVRHPACALHTVEQFTDRRLFTYAHSLLVLFLILLNFRHFSRISGISFLNKIATQ